MNFALQRWAGWLLGNTLLASAAVSGGEIGKKPEPSPESEAVLPGVFNTELPSLVRPEALRISLRPHFGDFLKEDYFRITVGARYGLTPQWELGADADTYISHGLDDVKAGEELGVSRIQLGVKYRFVDFLAPYWKAAAGLKYRFPVGNPPPDLTDGLYHITPYMTLSHDWESRPNFTTFVSYGVDFVSESDVAGNLEKGEINADNWFITPGVLWHRGAFDYSLEAELKTTWGLDSADEYRVTFRPGVKWTLPPEWKFHARSRWVVGLSVTAGYGTGGPDYGIGARVQTNFDFKRFFRGRPQTAPDAAK